MAKRQGLDDIIRDAINAVKDGALTTGKRPKRKQKISNFLPRINDDIKTDPLRNLPRPPRKNMPFKNPDRETPPRRRPYRGSRPPFEPDPSPRSPRPPRGGEKRIGPRLPKRPSRGPRQTKDDTNRTLPKRRLQESRIPKKKRNY